MNKTTITVADDKKTLIIKRHFTAPRAKVWAAFTEKEIFVKWYAPEGWATSVKTFNFEVGGETLYGMTCEDKNQGEWYGQTEWGKFVYTSIAAQDSYSFTNYFVDQDGNNQEGMPVSQTVMVFTEDGDTTSVVGTDVYESPQALQLVLEMGASEGIKEAWDQLATML